MVDNMLDPFEAQRDGSIEDENQRKVISQIPGAPVQRSPEDDFADQIPEGGVPPLTEEEQQEHGVNDLSSGQPQEQGIHKDKPLTVFEKRKLLNRMKEEKFQQELDQYPEMGRNATSFKDVEKEEKKFLREEKKSKLKEQSIRSNARRKALQSGDYREYMSLMDIEDQVKKATQTGAGALPGDQILGKTPEQPSGQPQQDARRQALQQKTEERSKFQEPDTGSLQVDLKEIYGVEPGDELYDYYVNDIYNEPDKYDDISDQSKNQARVHLANQSYKNKTDENADQYVIPKEILDSEFLKHIETTPEIEKVLSENGATIDDYKAQFATHFKDYPKETEGLPPVASKLADDLKLRGTQIQTLHKMMDDPIAKKEGIKKLAEGQEILTKIEQQKDEPVTSKEEKERRQELFAMWADYASRMMKAVLQYGNSMAASKAMIAGRQKVDTPKLDYELTNLTKQFKEQKASAEALKDKRQARDLRAAEILKTKSQTDLNKAKAGSEGKSKVSGRDIQVLNVPGKDGQVLYKAYNKVTQELGPAIAGKAFSNKYGIDPRTGNLINKETLLYGKRGNKGISQSGGKIPSDQVLQSRGQVPVSKGEPEKLSFPKSKYQTIDDLNPLKQKRILEVKKRYEKERGGIRDFEETINGLQSFVTANLDGTVGAIKRQLARTVGSEKGVMTDKDVAAFGGTDKVVTMIAQYAHAKVHGGMTDQIQSNFNNIIKVAQGNIKRKQKGLESEYLGHGRSLLGKDSKNVSDDMLKFLLTGQKSKKESKSPKSMQKLLNKVKKKSKGGLSTSQIKQKYPQTKDWDDEKIQRFKKHKGL